MISRPTRSVTVNASVAVLPRYGRGGENYDVRVFVYRRVDTPSHPVRAGAVHSSDNLLYATVISRRNAMTRSRFL